MLLKRVLSAIIGIIFIIFFIFWGSLPFTFLIVLVSFLALYEYDRMLPVNYKNNNILLSVFSIIILLYSYLNNREIIKLSPGLFLFIMLLSLFVYHIFRVDNNNFFARISYNLLGIIYIAGGLSFFILLRDFNLGPFSGTMAIWLALLATWAEDTGAYFVGVKFGKTKFIDKSPNKSVEGIIGGLLSSIIVISIYTSLIGIFSFRWLIYAFFTAIVAMIGDLFESSIKRATGVKDAGNLIPGHGGILDRIDSLLFSVPFTYFFLLYVL